MYPFAFHIYIFFNGTALLYPVYAPVSPLNTYRDLLLTSKGGSCASEKVNELSDPDRSSDPATSLCVYCRILSPAIESLCRLLDPDRAKLLGEEINGNKLNFLNN